MLALSPAEGSLARCTEVGLKFGPEGGRVAVRIPWGDDGEVESAVESYMRVARVLRLDDAYFYLPGAEALPVDPRNEAMCLWDLRGHVEAHGGKVEGGASGAAARILESVARRERALSAELDSASPRVVSRGGDEDDIDKGNTDIVGNNLVAWAKGKGIRLAPGLAMASMGARQRGLVAQVDVSVGECLVEVPSTCLIHEGNAMQTDLGKLVTQVWGHVDGENTLLLWLMRERERARLRARGETLMVKGVDVLGDVDRPEWGPYLASLPDQYGTMLSADERVFECLAGTMADGIARNAHAHVRAAYQGLDVPGLSAAFPAVFSPANAFTEANYVWAVETFYSRGLQVAGLTGPDGREGEATTCLVPLADMFNHSPSAHIWAYGRLDAESGTLKFRATRPVSVSGHDDGKSTEGDAAGRCEVSLGYGALSNTDLLVFHGFSVPGNPNDYFAVTVDLDEAEDAGRKRALLARFGVDDPENHRLRRPPAVPAGGVGSLSPSLVATLQVMLMDDKQLGRVEKAAKKALDKAAQSEGPYTGVHVLRHLLHAQGIRRWGALRVVSDLVEALLANLGDPPSSSASQTQMSPHLAEAQRYCLEQRTILRAALAEATTGEIDSHI